VRYFFVLIVTLFLWCASSASIAQVSVNVNFNLDSQPAWGPTGYDYVEYYYLPEIDIYYYVPQHRYYYYDSGRWQYSSHLPYRYSSYNLYNSYKVVVNEREPWRNDKIYREKYYSYKDHHDQQPIRDSQDSKYFVNKYHPEHNNWVHQQGQENSKNNNKQNNNGDKHNNGNNKK
jgi:hypothetical protein